MKTLELQTGVKGGQSCQDLWNQYGRQCWGNWQDWAKASPKTNYAPSATHSTSTPHWSEVTCHLGQTLPLPRPPDGGRGTGVFPHRFGG